LGGLLELRMVALLRAVGVAIASSANVARKVVTYAEFPATDPAGGRYRLFRAGVHPPHHWQ